MKKNESRDLLFYEEHFNKVGSQTYIFCFILTCHNTRSLYYIGIKKKIRGIYFMQLETHSKLINK